MKFIPPVLDPDAVPGKPAPLIPVMGRLTPSAIPVIGLPPAVPFLAVPILPVVDVPGGRPLDVPGGLLPWLVLIAD